MFTFLPFPRSVKQRARALGVCTALIGVNCAGGSAPRRSAGPPIGLLPAADGSAVDVGDASTSDAAAVSTPIANSDAGAALSATSAVELTLDLPYPVDARPRAVSPMQAAAEDEALASWNVGGTSDPAYPSSRSSYHPGTRVVVETRLAKHRPGNPLQVAPKHGLTLDRVQAQARSRGYWPFRLCFEAGQHEKKSAGGETRVAFSVGLRGKVSRAWLLDSKLGNASTAACLVRETNKLEFTPHPARALALVASIRIWPGDADLPTLPELTTPAGEFDPEAVRARLARKLPELTSCFADARRGDPALWGRLALATILEVDGSVHRVSEVESQFPNAAAVHCAQVLIGGIAFPSVNGKPFTVVLPMRLDPPTPVTTTGPDVSPSPQEPASDAGSD